jgi:hypothetical protein
MTLDRKRKPAQRAPQFMHPLIQRFNFPKLNRFMTLCEMLFFVAMARAELQLQGTAQDVGLGGVPWRQYIYLTVVLAITQGTGSVALSYVNMPVKVVMKSCKLIPTMVSYTTTPLSPFPPFSLPSPPLPGAFKTSGPLRGFITSAACRTCRFAKSVTLCRVLKNFVSDVGARTCPPPGVARRWAS